ncbi:MAG: hypothetical protein AAFU71_00355 [Cyanobacteria bacterium J06632_22]
MGRLIAGLGLAVVLVILALQNLSPTLTLVVLGTPTIALPFSVWLLGSVAVGVLLTLLISALLRLAAPVRRPYRPLGQRVRQPATGDDAGPAAYASSPYRDDDRDYHRDDGPDRSFANDHAYDAGATSPQQTGAFVPPDAAAPKTDPDAEVEDWEDYRPPSQWEEWGQRPEPGTTTATPERRGFRFRQAPYAADATMDELASGWEEYDPDRGDGPSYDAYEEAGRSGYRRYEDPPYDDRGYDPPTQDGQDDYADLANGWEEDAAPRPRVHPDGYLYGEGSASDPAPEESPEDVYDADFRVIIPPYDPNRAPDDSQS